MKLFPVLMISGGILFMYVIVHNVNILDQKQQSSPVTTTCR